MNVHLPGFTPPQGATLNIRIDLTTQINITALVARQRVNVFVIMKVSNQLLAGSPELVVGERLCWLVPVMLTSPRKGIIGKVGEIIVDATTGELLIDEKTIPGLTDNTNDLAERCPL